MQYLKRTSRLLPAAQSAGPVRAPTPTTALILMCITWMFLDIRAIYVDPLYSEVTFDQEGTKNRHTQHTHAPT
jgi:hypothetical protein